MGPAGSVRERVRSGVTLWGARGAGRIGAEDMVRVGREASQRETRRRAQAIRAILPRAVFNPRSLQKRTGGGQRSPFACRPWAMSRCLAMRAQLPGGPSAPIAAPRAGCPFNCFDVFFLFFIFNHLTFQIVCNCLEDIIDVGFIVVFLRDNRPSLSQHEKSHFN